MNKPQGYPYFDIGFTFEWGGLSYKIVDYSAYSGYRIVERTTSDIAGRYRRFTLSLDALDRITDIVGGG